LCDSKRSPTEVYACAMSLMNSTWSSAYSQRAVLRYATEKVLVWTTHTHTHTHTHTSMFAHNIYIRMLAHYTHTHTPHACMHIPTCQHACTRYLRVPFSECQASLVGAAS
jgi:hypothetical protein